MSQIKSRAVDTNHYQHCLAVIRVREFCLKYEVISLWPVHAGKAMRENTQPQESSEI
jgi:hypothetical protein